MSIKLGEYAGFSVDQRVYLRKTTQGSTFVEVGGDDREDEITYPAGSPALIDRIEDFGGSQGIAFTVQIGEITNVFDQGDGPITDLLSAEPLPAITSAQVPETKTFDATISLTAEKISDQVVTAVEGGIAYWASGFYLDHPSRENLFEKPWYADPKLYEGDFKIRVVQQEEHIAGAGVEVFLTPDSIRTGLKVMAEKYGSHFADMIQENGDATTADVFLQCCVFGDLIYG